MARKTKIQTETLVEENSSELVALIPEQETTDKITPDIEQKTTNIDEVTDINTEAINDYKVLLEGSASKLSPKSEGHITFQLIKDNEEVISIQLLANTSGGNFCKTAIPIKSIIDVLTKQPANKGLKSLVIKDVFIGKGAKSSNNPAFLVCALRAPEIGLLVPNEKSKFLSNLSADFKEQSAKLLSL